MNNNSSEINEIKGRYKASLVDKKKLIDDYVFQLETLEAQSAVSVKVDGVLNNIHDDMHKLAGSSGMYGYMDIASTSRLVMKNVVGKDKLETLKNLKQLSDLLGTYCVN